MLFGSRSALERSAGPGFGVDRGDDGGLAGELMVGDFEAGTDGEDSWFLQAGQVFADGLVDEVGGRRGLWRHGGSRRFSLAFCLSEV